ncbi:hypothetical protein NQ176_g4502 [Zarea fungicola]|uniref:Uncharacterized protein n=1 Tax=Zarea fungicola TaxID=93591 RepID=A0ACC1NFB7_9HYPO|nr:hypothetical protein NQ176_g4502 [Lecanicillium fungicola]
MSQPEQSDKWTKSVAVVGLGTAIGALCVTAAKKFGAFMQKRTELRLKEREVELKEGEQFNLKNELRSLQSGVTEQFKQQQQRQQGLNDTQVSMAAEIKGAVAESKEA